MFRDEMRHFLACCAGTESPRCTIHDGIRALEVAVAIIDSEATANPALRAGQAGTEQDELSDK